MKRGAVRIYLLCFFFISSIALADPPITDSDASLDIGGDTPIHGPITGAKVEGGFQMQWGACPCMRWTIEVELIGGAIETREFLISTDAIFKFNQNETLHGEAMASRLFRIGALEALYKPGHVGVGFSGVTLGENRDLSYSDIVETGAYFILNIFRTATTRLDVRSGYQYESMKVGLNPGKVEHQELPQSVVFTWTKGRWSARVDATLFVEPLEHLSGAKDVHFSTSGQLQADLYRGKDVLIGSGFGLSYEREPWREMFGLSPDIAIAGLRMNVRFR